MTKQKLLEHAWHLSPLKAHHCKGFKKPGFVEGFEACLELLWPMVGTVVNIDELSPTDKIGFDRLIGELVKSFLELEKKLEP